MQRPTFGRLKTAPSSLKAAPGIVQVGLCKIGDNARCCGVAPHPHVFYLFPLFLFPFSANDGFRLPAHGSGDCFYPCGCPKAKCPSKTDGLDGHCWHELFPIKVGYVYLSICPGRRRVFLRTWLRRHRSSMLTPRLAAMEESVSPLATL